MIPFDLVCKNCLWILRQGKKINALKEKVSCENYLDLKIFRFYFKCTNCKKGISLKTNPENSNYQPEINCKI